ncbi:hypothetical protein LshimejAT787_0506220 [Lyophyllum shimeji]|uniref:Uncharacterized protein n=1 Tax=Lyophyllum shimeji TaxID=47721 RepID=A0A9P3UMX2_LYOSH|nr:hypothetical protein LshimejAT787_0506220 [Lyophyllum shimeji]
MMLLLLLRPACKRTYWHTESGIYYLVPNKYGPGKTLVRRPRPPPTSAPLEDDFDAATTTRGARTEWDLPPQGSDRARSPSPLVPGSTSGAARRLTPNRTASPPAGTAAPPKTTSHSSASPRRMNGAPPLSGEAAATNTGRKETSREAHDASETYGEYGHYMTELERKFGGSPDLTLSPTRARRSQEMDRGHVQIASMASAGAGAGISRIGKPSRLGSVGRPGVAGGSGSGPGRGQQSFEIVDKRILEDGPERTVTISTWREQVAEQADPQADHMEIYYLDAHDYAEGVEDQSEGGHGGGETVSMSEADSNTGRKGRSLPPRPTEDIGSDPGSIRTITDEQSKESGSASERHTMLTTSTTTRKLSGHTSHAQSERTKPSTSGSSSPALWTRTPPRTPPCDIRSPEPRHYHDRGDSHSPTYQKLTNGTNGAGVSSPRSSAPTRRSPDGARPERSSHTPLRSSTPNRTYARLPTPSFHPTQSGSTISTIKSASTVAFENILASCEPPLLHISPALAKVGIMNESHLRAIARLSEETRDREIKEEALRQGVTVMEWAILLDKLQEL